MGDVEQPPDESTSLRTSLQLGGNLKTRKGGDDILKNDVFKFFEQEVPLGGKAVRYVIRLLQKPPMQILKGIVAIALFVGVALSLMPLGAVHYLNGLHWSKGVPFLMALPPLRLLMDGIYTFLIRKLKVVYIILKLMILLAVFPIVLIMAAFASLARIRVIIILCIAQPIISQIVAWLIRFLGPMWSDIVSSVRSSAEDSGASRAGGAVAATNKTTRRMILQSVISFVVLLFTIVYLHRRRPTIYEFCFDVIDVRTLVMLVFAIAIYMQISMVVYIDSVRAGRVQTGSTILTQRQIDKKSREMTIVVTFACVAALYLTMAMNPGYFARYALIEPRMIYLE